MWNVYSLPNVRHPKITPKTKHSLQSQVACCPVKET